jgi:hypothetical protein
MKEIITKAEKKEDLFNNIEENIDNFILLSNLTLLSKVQKYEKLIIKKRQNNSDLNFEIQIDNSYLPSIKRFFYGNDRDKTIEYLNKLINYGIEKYNEEKKNEEKKNEEKKNDNKIAMNKIAMNKIAMNKIASLLESSKLGLSNLKITYNTDQSITSKIDIIIDTIDVFRINIHSI